MKSKSRIRVAVIQLAAGADWKKNWKRTEKQLSFAAQAQADLILLPENFIARTSDKELNFIAHHVVPLILEQLRDFSKKNNLFIAAGSVPEFLKSGKGQLGEKTSNTCYVFSDQGKMILKYRKMHLFDIDIPGVRVMESKWVQPGSQPGFFKMKGVGIGVGICYDLRFPEYFRALVKRGTEMFLIPANFTAETGKTAWEVLLRARAIENQSFVLAAGQFGKHPESGIRSYGNSMIIDPLGRALKRASFSGASTLIADIDLTDLRTLRRRFPVLKHRKINV